MKTTTSILCLGSVCWDEHIFIPEAHLHCHRSEPLCDLALPLGIKISSPPLEETPGGNAGNVAVGLSRLGLPVELVSWVGSDGAGKKIISQLRKEKLRLNLSPVTGSNRSIILHCGAERTIISTHAHHRYNLPLSINSKLGTTPRGSIRQNTINYDVIYLTSMAKGSEPLLRIVTSLNSRIKVIFNPGGYQLSLKNKLQPLLRRSDILILNKQEAQQIVGISSPRSVDGLMAALLSLGTRIVVITDGANGAWAGNATNGFHHPPLKTKTLDTTGAGDAFAAGFVGAHLRGWSLQNSLRAGIINSSSVIGKVGAQAGLLNMASLIRRMAPKPPSTRSAKISRAT